MNHAKKMKEKSSQAFCTYLIITVLCIGDTVISALAKEQHSLPNIERNNDVITAEQVRVYRGVQHGRAISLRQLLLMNRT